MELLSVFPVQVWNRMESNSPSIYVIWALLLSSLSRSLGFLLCLFLVITLHGNQISALGTFPFFSDQYLNVFSISVSCKLLLVIICYVAGLLNSRIDSTFFRLLGSLLVTAATGILLSMLPQNWILIDQFLSFGVNTILCFVLVVIGLFICMVVEAVLPSDGGFSMLFMTFLFIVMGTGMHHNAFIYIGVSGPYAITTTIVFLVSCIIYWIRIVRLDSNNDSSDDNQISVTQAIESGFAIFWLPLDGVLALFRWFSKRVISK